MKEKTLKIISYAYILIPVLFFLFGWLKLYIAIPTGILLLYAFYKILKSEDEKDEKIIEINKMFIIFEAMLILSILAGQGGLFYQSPDHNWRNAVLRDLINNSWPVYYDVSNTYLDYYIGHWMVPAAIGKLFLPISETMAWFAGNMALLLWTTIGVTLCCLWIIKLLKNKEKSFWAIAIFLFFSGLDVIGAIFYNIEIFKDFHIEWWAEKYQFSSIITQLFWVFNQTTVTWLITLMFLNEKKLKNYMVLILLYLPYAPLPFIGAIPLFACRGIEKLIQSIKEKNVKGFFKEVLSVQNIIFFVIILPIYFWYYRSNASTVNNGGINIMEISTFSDVLHLITFWLLEIGIYGILIFRKYKKVPLFWVSFVSLIFIPLVLVGQANDFAMRASIPGMVVCIYFITDYLLNNEKSIKRVKIILCILLIIGAVTPGVEFCRAFKNVYDARSICVVADGLKTINSKPTKGNFLFNFITCDSEKDVSIFFKYLIKGKN